MSTIANPLCPNCGAALPPREASAVYHCGFCKRTFEVDAPTAARAVPLTERTTSPEFDQLCANAERLIVDVERTHATMTAKAVDMGERAVMLQKMATKKLHERFATTRKAIAERDEATLRDCVERLTAVQQSG